jgi:aminoglycoside phosphotransferase (APT) family kinase protein
MMQKLRIRIGSVGTFHGVTNSLYDSPVVRDAGAMEAPPAEGVRVPYDGTPAALRAWVDGVLGSAVVSAVTQPGGFSPGVAARLVCADGTRAFCKAVSSSPNPDSPQMHRIEARVTAALPVTAPAPRLLAPYDDGAWVALLLEDVEGQHPAQPWQPAELSRVVAAIDELAALLTPCPLPVSDIADSWRIELTNWRLLVEEPLPGLDDWSLRHLDALAALEGRWEAASTGDTLLHMDLRADNMLVTDDRVWLVDWPWAARGHPLLDLVAFAPSVSMQGGPEPGDLLGLSRTGRAADPDRLLPLVAAVAGYFTRRSLLPPPPGLPTVRAFQAAQGEVTLRWLAALTGWR